MCHEGPEAVRALATIENNQARLRFYSVEAGQPVYALIPARYRGLWVWGQKAGSPTWEFPSGHIEPGEAPLEAAHRELREESGATEYDLRFVGAYSVEEKTTTGGWSPPVYGRLFYADIHALGPLRHEIVHLGFFEAVPEALSYPHIQPHIIRWVRAWLGLRD